MAYYYLYLCMKFSKYISDCFFKQSYHAGNFFLASYHCLIAFSLKSAATYLPTQSPMQYSRPDKS